MYVIEPVDLEEINVKVKRKWDPLYDALTNAEASAAGGGVFVIGIAKSDLQGMSNSIRKRVSDNGMRLRWRSAERNGSAGYYIWVERR